jgi:uncharacterized protein YqeY
VTAAEIRAALRRDLHAALKSRQSEVVAALRTALAAIDDAEAVDPTSGGATLGAGPIAGATRGVGSSDVARRALSADDVRGVLRRQVDDYSAEADRYETLGRPDAAARLRREAGALDRYL